MRHYSVDSIKANATYFLSISLGLSSTGQNAMIIACSIKFQFSDKNRFLQSKKLELFRKDFAVSIQICVNM